MITVGLNSFVLRQTKDDFVGTKLKERDLLAFRDIATIALNLSSEFTDEEQRELTKPIRVQNGYDDCVRRQ